MPVDFCDASDHSLVGSLHVVRPTYREVGVRNGPTVVPLELEAGLMEGATPALGHSVSQALGLAPMREHELRAQSMYRPMPSRSTLDRIAKRLGTVAQGQAERIEPHLRRREQIPPGTQALSLGLDRTSVPMEEERSADAPPKTRRKKRSKPYIRAVPPPVDVNYRMAYVGTVSFVDEDGESLHTVRYAASAREGPDDVLVKMMADLRRALRQASLPVGVVQDGAPELWNLLRGALGQESCVDSWLEAIDRFHLLERLGQVLAIVEPDAAARKQTLHRWNEALDCDDDTIDAIESWLVSVMKSYLGKDLETLKEAQTYLANNKDRMRYVSLRQAGLPVGSGATEGACKSLITARAKRSGQRWHDEGIDAVLTLRALQQSDRLPQFCERLRRTHYSAEIAIAA